MDPITIAFRLLLPAAMAGVWALIVARWGRDPADRARWTWPGVAVALLVAWPGSFTALTSWPWPMPDGMVWSMVVLMLAAVTRWGMRTGPVRMVGTVVLLLLALLPTFPWWTRGVSGWGIWLGFALAAAVLAHGARTIIADDRWRGVWLWAVVLAVAPAAVVAMANVSQAITLASVGLAVGGAALIGSLRGNDFLAGRADVIPAGMVVLLVGNARLRYVAGPEEAAWESWLLLLGPALLLAVPWVWRLAAAKGAPRLGAGLAAVVAILAAALSLSAYLYEGGSADQADPGWDYGAMGS